VGQWWVGHGGPPGAVRTTTLPRRNTDHARVLKNSSDATLADINVKAFVDAATGAYPAWFPYVVTARFVLATLGSLLIINLLAVPSANAYFR
jgi:hypothetical protein